MEIDLKKLQKEVFQNKLDKGFNTTDIAVEFCRAHEELSEAFKEYQMGDDKKMAEELADVAIFLLGMSEIIGFDLAEEIARKVKINKNRTYKKMTNDHGKIVFVREKTEIDP
jgi:NTP pyrophosphatase (non-canonical NTP hydrolase)